MTDLPDTPLRETAAESTPWTDGWRWLRVLLWAVGVAWLLVLLGWAVLHALILPRIDAQRQWLETKASKALATQVHIGALQVQGNWLVPWLEATDVTLRDAQDRVVLQLPRVVASVSPWSTAS